MRRITLVVLAAGLLLFAPAARADDSATVMMPTYAVAHCDLDRGSSKANVGYAFHTASGAIVAAWWNERELGEGQYAAMSVVWDTVTVKIWERTPYHSYVTVASKSCWGGH